MLAPHVEGPRRGHVGRVARRLVPLGALLAVGLIVASPAGSETLSTCLRKANSAADVRYKSSKARCYNGLLDNPNELTGIALKAEYQLCLHNAADVFNTDKATFSDECVKAHPTTTRKTAVAKPTAGNVTQFCVAAKRYLDLPATLPDTLDLAWVHANTEPLFTMARYAPADLVRDTLYVAVASYNLRFDGANAVNALEAKDINAFGQLLGVLIPVDITAGVASAHYSASFDVLTKGVTRVCGIDMAGIVQRKIAEALAS